MLSNGVYVSVECNANLQEIDYLASQKNNLK